MKYAIMSDIHGNLEAFKRAVADAKKRKCQKIICLGDPMSLMLEVSGCPAKVRAAHIAHMTSRTENCNLFFLRNRLTNRLSVRRARG